MVAESVNMSHRPSFVVTCRLAVKVIVNLCQEFREFGSAMGWSEVVPDSPDLAENVLGNNLKSLVLFNLLSFFLWFGGVPANLYEKLKLL